MESKINGIDATATVVKDKPIKRLRYCSEEYVAYVEIKLEAKVIDQRPVGFYYGQDKLSKASASVLLSQGEITFARGQRILGIDFDFVKNDIGIELVFEWATYELPYKSKYYKTNEKIIFSIPFGSLTLKNQNIEYNLYPEPNEKQKICLTVIEANFHVLNSNQSQFHIYKEKLDEIFDDPDTINIDLDFESPRRNRPNKEKNTDIF